MRCGAKGSKWPPRRRRRFALTTLEYNAPSVIDVRANMPRDGALEIARIIHADPKNAALPVNSDGDGSHARAESPFKRVATDYIYRICRWVIASHIKNI